MAGGRGHPASDGTRESVSIPVGGSARLDGDLVRPAGAAGLVVFVHGSGSSRHSPRNQAVARLLESAGFATLLFDLLTEAEERVDAGTGEFRFDIALLGQRTVAAVDWLGARDSTRGLPLYLFGASTGAAAALIAAAERPDRVAAVACRGGRPDLAGYELGRVRAPVLLIVGGRDLDVLDLNRRAAGELAAEHRVDVIEGATHLFAEDGALRQVALAARDWFTRFEP